MNCANALICVALSARDVGITMSTVNVGGTVGHSKPCAASDMFAFGVLMLNSIHPPADMGRYPVK
jgi:hypothetical protein